ncbi:tripartite tricarboxylate transporter substrate binding protein [Pulveribacter sp.]|uniref:tripartite tricarboxylate transporter substrate binding protein n=1 Tax=Pulveribacter sp. TaxID=2678893 RepID=UPI0028A6788D|nr:tripartite tricarboxylate transporter substrate binding protein [Pulveribacter sp.]
MEKNFFARLAKGSGALGLALLAWAPQAHAAWPSDAPIQVVVGFAPGGTTDIMARTIAPFIAKHLGDGANLAIMNKPGAGGEISVAQVMRAKPDGYTIGIVNLPGYFFLPMHRKTSYTTKDLTLVARVVSDPTVVVTRKDGPYTSLQQVVEQLKKDPQSVSGGHNGIGTNGHIAMINFDKAAQVQINSIPYSGNAQQRTALVSKQLDLAFMSASDMMNPDAEPVPLRMLSQFTRSKVERLGDVPSSFEQGYPVEMTAERGFAAPNNVPAPILARLQKAIEAAIKDPEYVKAARNDAPFLSYLDGASWSAAIERELPAYEAIAKTLPKD